MLQGHDPSTLLLIQRELVILSSVACLANMALCRPGAFTAIACITSTCKEWQSYGSASQIRCSKAEETHDHAAAMFQTWSN